MDRYLVHGELGAGGMGTVVLAFDTRLLRDVALKVVPIPPQATDADRLLREGRALAMLNHPNVVTVYDVHRTDDSVLVAMELLRADTLQTWLRQPRTRAEILAAFATAGRALSAAHSVGLIHRDFKLSNVMVDPAGTVTVVDFGLATLGSKSSPDDDVGSEDLTRSVMSTAADSPRHVVGTPLYMAPEQHDGAADAASDQYQFCLALLEALSGSWPFATRDGEALVQAKREEAFGPRAFSAIPRSIRRTLRRGLRADPSQRWPSLSHVVDALQRRRSRYWWLAPVGVGGVALATLPQSAPPPIDPCAAMLQTMANSWNEERAQLVESAFVDTGIPTAPQLIERTRDALDDYTRQWRSTHQAVCAPSAAGPPRSDKLVDAKLHCLVRARRRMHALIDAIATLPPERLMGVPRAVEGLPTIHRCEQATVVEQGQTVSEPWVASRVRQLEESLDRAHTLVLVGQFQSADETARTVARGAEQIEHQRLRVTALAVRTRSLRALDHPDTLPVGEEAYRAARLAGDNLTAWKVASDVSTAYSRIGEYELAKAWLDDNEMLVFELGIPSEEAAFLSALGRFHFERGEHDESLVATLEALEILETHAPGGRPHAVAVRRLAGVLHALGRLEDAATELERASTMLVNNQGSDDPDLRFVLFEQGLLALRRERFAEAAELLERTLALIVQLQTDQSIAAIECRGALARAYLGSGRDNDAKDTIDRALADAGAIDIAPRAKLLLHNDRSQIAETQGDTAGAIKHMRASLHAAAQMQPSPSRTRVMKQVKESARKMAQSLDDDEIAAGLRQVIAATE